LPVLAEVQGRSTDFVVARDGTIMHGLALIYVIRDISGIEKFKITQESLDYTKIDLVPEKEFDPASITIIEKGIKDRLGDTVRVEINMLDSIPAEASGKFRYVISKVRAS
jgi:phenylacetate-CoA ligase